MWVFYSYCVSFYQPDPDIKSHSARNSEYHIKKKTVCHWKNLRSQWCIPLQITQEIGQVINNACHFLEDHLVARNGSYLGACSERWGQAGPSAWGAALVQGWEGCPDLRGLGGPAELHFDMVTNNRPTALQINCLCLNNSTVTNTNQ